MAKEAELRLIEILEGLAKGQLVMTEILKGGNGGGGGGDGGRGGGGGIWGGREVLDGRKMSALENYAGGESQWREWSRTVRNVVRTRSALLARLLEYVEANPDVGTETAIRTLEGMDEHGSLEGEYAKWKQVAGEFYSWLEVKTVGEAKGVVQQSEAQCGDEGGDGIRAWAMLHSQYNKRTISRLMRIQNKCMYPKQADVKNLTAAVMVWESDWRKMTLELKDGEKVPNTWKMGAFMQLCPKDAVEMMDARWDEVKEDYDVLKNKILTWAQSKVEKMGGGGPVPMDIGSAAEDYSGYQYDEKAADDGTDGGIGAVYGNSQCFNCGLYGHFSRECPVPKGKGKGKMGGKAGGKSGGPGTFDVKGKGKGKSVGQGNAAWTWASYGGKTGGKSGGKGYQGTCWKCGKVGHKALECGVGMIGQAEEEEQSGTAEVNTVMIGAVEERCGRWGCKDHLGLGLTRRPMGRSLEAFMPKKVELRNSFGIFEVNNDEGEEIGNVGIEDDADDFVGGVIEVTVESGASKSVAPRGMKGLQRKNTCKEALPKLHAANGTNIQVDSEAVVEFEKDGKKCGMKFLEADVRKPLGSVAAIVDEGNVCVFRKSGGYIQNEATGMKIEMIRKGGTFVMRLDGVKEVADARKKKMGKADGMEIDEVQKTDGEEKTKIVAKLREEYERKVQEMMGRGEVIFRRQAP